jgi:predicted phosphate transport protein (TIGR00153 family)
MLETEADALKSRLRGSLPKGTLMPVNKFQLLQYLREQDNLLHALEEALDWISFRSEPGIPAELQRDFFTLVDTILDPVEEMCKMVAEAGKYFKNFSAKQGKLVTDIIHTIREQGKEADKVEDAIMQKVLNMHVDPVTIFHLIRLAERIGSIADHAENAGDMMRTMLTT